ncbi:MAG: 3-methyl-2-oxobutanoate hydroxymethyltransferase [Candidatus Omnitrophica bacterium]|nr:3-methyl-2-oxobutanoate hydroxymethyltransferase [Candidatus Omnitrophota bacterium]
MVKTSDFIRAKKHHKRWVALTAYDAPTAALLETCGVDILLVGDSLGMVLLGYSSTLPVTMDEMIHHAKAVRRGAPNSFIVGDLPYQGVRSGARQALRSAKRFLKEGGCDAVKLEWSKNAAETTALLVKNKVPVMGHVGLTPQQVRSQEGFKVHGRRAGEAFEIFRQARLFEDVGAFSVLVECVPAPVVRAITRTLRIPTLGIGSGKFCDGQVLVFHDLVGIFKKFTPKFVKQYARLDALMERAVKTYRREVLQSRFPGRVHSFKMEPAEWDAFHRRLRQEKK